MRTVHVHSQRVPVRGAFTIARGAKTHVDVLRVRITQGPHHGEGEATPIYYHADSIETALESARAAAPALEAGANRADLLGLLPPGATRNALDCALWALEARQQGSSVRALLGLPPFQPMLTAYTISLDSPEAMAAVARREASRELIKLKLGGEGGPAQDLARLAAVRAAAPHARLIVDANEAWGEADLPPLLAALAEAGVELVEQPVPAGRDQLLDRLASPVPLCADESCQDRQSLDAIIGRYRFINIKLDKAGGLTEALALAHAARQRGLGIMTGCMLGTSLAIAPAFHLATQGLYADLDAPLLVEDPPGGFAFHHSDIMPPPPGLWA